MRWPDRLVVALSLALTAAGCARPMGERFLTPARGGWRRVGAVRHFTRENLYDTINGEADFVVSFGFRSLAQADYRRGATAETVVDLYDMGSTSNAFALFRSRSNVEGQPLDVGSEGAGDESRIEFWQGPFYVELRIPSAEERPSVLALAREFAGALPPTEAWPAYLKLLPTGTRVARSEQYLPSDFLGRAFLQRAVSARYKLPGREAVVFACRYDSPKEAAAALERFEAVLRKQRLTRPLALGEKGFLADDDLLGTLAVFRRGRYLGGMTRHAKDPATGALLADLDRRLAGGGEGKPPR